MTRRDGGGKRDRTARLLRVLSVLQAAGEGGITAGDVAKRTDMSLRSAYRDIRALEGELEIPTWNEGGRWGVVSAETFLPPLKLTQQEAVAVVLAARLMTRFADEYDPVLSAAFEKLAEALPAPLRLHVARTLDSLATRRLDTEFNRRVGQLTTAWAQGRVVEFTYAPAWYDGQQPPPVRRTVRPYLLEPSVQTHALYLIGYDEGRGAMRTFKVERISDLSVTPRTFDAPDPLELERELRSAWDIISDQPVTEVVLRFAPPVAARVHEASWHPTQRVTEEPDGSLTWRARVAGTVEIRLWILSWGDDVEVVSPAALRKDVAATHARAAARYAGPARRRAAG